MNRTRKALPDTRVPCVVVMALLAAAPAVADDYGEARAKLVAAYEARDYAAMRAAAERAERARPGHPGARFNLALAQVLDGDAALALATLQALLDQQIDFGVAEIPDFEALRALPGWAAYRDGVAALAKPVGAAEVAWRHDAGDFIPEGIAVDANSSGAWLGSIRFGTIHRVGQDAGVAAVPGPHWSVYGMRLRGDRLWFVSAAVDQYVALDPADAGRTGLFSADTRDGQVAAELYLPGGEGPQVLGDLEFGAGSDVYLADQAGGTLFRYDTASKALSALTGPGDFVSPQGLVLDAEGTQLYVADYSGGLYRLHPGTGVATRVTADAATNLYGIDGLYRHGASLVAIQNGIRPNRVVQLYLAEDGATVTRSRILAMSLPEFDEPNLGQAVGEDFYFIANSHWNRFDADGNLPAGLEGPVVLRVHLGAAP